MRPLVEAFFLKVWSQRGLFAILLWPLSKIFGLILNFRFGLLILGYRKQTKLHVPVIIVGNIFVGGTGKTPMVIYLVEQLRAAGWTPGVISRGYGANVETVIAVTSESPVTQVGDEPLLIVQRTHCPMMVGRARVASAQQLLVQHPEVDILIADDGLQHYALARDIEILMFDQRGIGNAWLLPAGPLRESPQRRRDFTVLTGVDSSIKNPSLEARISNGEPVHAMSLHIDQLRQLNDASQRLSFPELSTKRILAVAGIGNPKRFFAMLQAQGLQLRTRALPDHFVFSENIFAGDEAEIILITEKDAVKCRQITALCEDTRIWVVPVSAQLEADFMVQLLSMISEKKNGCTPA